jgi:hypothetical protein
LIPTPIRKVLSTIRKHHVRSLLMGGQACVFYGAAQFSKDIDFVVLAEPENFRRLLAALDELQAGRIAVPPFDPALLNKGHAVHFRCQHPEAAGIRVDVMTRLRDLAPFEELWLRRATITESSGETFELMGIGDLVEAKKTQRDKDWPMIAMLVEANCVALRGEATSERIRFWLREARSSERLCELAQSFPDECRALSSERALLSLAIAGNEEALRSALHAEELIERNRDREYWRPLRQELEALRRVESSRRGPPGAA